jgi:hypothetical protein
VPRLRAVALSSAGASAIAVVCAASAPAVSTGCQTHQCDPDCVWLNNATSPQSAGSICEQGEAPDQYFTYDGADHIVWATSGMTDPWLDFPGQRTWTLYLTPPGMSPSLSDLLFVPDGGTPEWRIEAPTIWISTLPQQSDPGDTMTPASGQLAELPFVDGVSVTVTNATCAHYYLYVQVDAYRNVQTPPDGGP